MSQCKLNCSFEPRYDYKMPENYTIPESDYQVDVDDIVRMLETLRTKTYVHDICVNCGKIAERK